MSADRWTICPKCWTDTERDEVDTETAQAALEADIAAFTAKYGEQRGGEYRKIMLSTLEPMKPEDTMREDWGLGIVSPDAGGVFYLKYKAECTKCGWKYEKRIQEKVA